MKRTILRVTLMGYFIGVSGPFAATQSEPHETAKLSIERGFATIDSAYKVKRTDAFESRRDQQERRLTVAKSKYNYLRKKLEGGYLPEFKDKFGQESWLFPMLVKVHEFGNQPFEKIKEQLLGFSYTDPLALPGQGSLLTITAPAELKEKYLQAQKIYQENQNHWPQILAHLEAWTPAVEELAKANEELGDRSAAEAGEITPTPPTGRH